MKTLKLDLDGNRKLGNEVLVSKETYDQELSMKVLRAIQLGE